MKINRLICWLAAFALAPAAFADESLDSWLVTQTERSTQGMLANITPWGAVIASPSSEPDYRYHWIRDGALTMGTVQGLREGTDALVWNYAEFSRRNQLTSNASGGADGLGLGEPKFNLDGTAYLRDWGRPQNDGPALRASTLIRFAHRLLDQGQFAEVRARLYDPKLPGGRVIKADLEFVSHHWRDPSFDLWEEVRGTHFYTRLVQRRALLDGAGLAERLGDPGAANWYRQQARLLEGEITRHWDSKHEQIRATLDGSSDAKPSGLDVAVVLGALHALSGGDSFFSVTDPRVLITAQKIEDAFKREYAINRRALDGEGLDMGTAIGRYPEDRYDGHSTTGRGNPWFLATAAFAELYYKTATRIEADGGVKITSLSARSFNRLAELSRLGGVRSGERLRGRDPRFAALLKGLREKGDAYLRRVRYHAPADGSLSEQFNRDNGYMQSADELTWSHAGLLTAAWARSAGY
jgi:glucoamylase